MVADLASYQKFKYCFIVDGLLFSYVSSNDTNISFITASGLNDAKNSFINNKLYKTPGLINLTKIKYWNLVIWKLNWININFIDSEYTENVFFGFRLITKIHPIY